MAAHLHVPPTPPTAWAAGTAALAEALPALLALALMLGIGAVVLLRVAARLRGACRTRVWLRRERERARSDGQLQHLQGLLFHLQAVHDLLPGRPMEARRALDHAIAAGDGLVADLLKAASVADPLSTPEDLARALGLVATELATCGGGSLELRVLARGRPRSVPGQAHDGLLQAAREALSNAMQHSRGRHIELELAYQRHGLTLSVRDDGDGLGNGAADRGPRGALAAVCRISSAIGARVEVWGRAGAGTEVTITWPWRQAAAGGHG